MTAKKRPLPKAFADNIERVRRGEKPLNKAELAAADKPKTVKRPARKKKLSMPTTKEVTT